MAYQKLFKKEELYRRFKVFFILEKCFDKWRSKIKSIQISLTDCVQVINEIIFFFNVHLINIVRNEHLHIM